MRFGAALPFAIVCANVSVGADFMIQAQAAGGVFTLRDYGRSVWDRMDAMGTEAVELASTASGETGPEDTPAPPAPVMTARPAKPAAMTPPAPPDPKPVVRRETRGVSGFGAGNCTQVGAMKRCTIGD
ncbi:hypothetical protein SAMN04490248_101202 [Salinihabitans flavidus]|uniref:Uncharacterized protein n=1 Tax=Salinihabitans flavidus TaxID=569882 RepID=A0A1H8LLU8_9RHOB|nr:hypothetical protein [Salinihabitans flavidus]SEO06077.1 hypothetical protein SAMN04490248_101202 [Salinihabitans flavidus]